MAPSICEEAAYKLQSKKVTQNYRNRPQECPTYFFPRENVVDLKSSAREIYLCDCEKCKRLSGTDDGSDNRASYFKEIEEKLLGEFLLIFALLILHTIPGLITEFINRNVKLDGSNFLNVEQLRFLHSLKGIIPNEADSHQDKILQDQFRFQIRELNTSTEIIEYDKKEIVPIQDNDAIEGKGQFGEVIGFEFLHKDYEGTGFEEFKKGTRSRFVRKTFSGKKVDAGKAEWDIYVRDVNPMRNPHFMQALGAFSHGECFSIIFTHAESTFERLLTSDEPELSSKARWEQMTEVTKALACLHEAKKSHSDLKPLNLLIQDGQIKISDFGSAEDTEETDSVEAARTWLAARVYSPKEHVRGPSYDIYSLGAMLSELATSDIQGRDGLIDYGNIRSSEDDEALIPNSRCFYLHQSGELKTAVKVRHIDLLALVDELSHWHRRFYTRDLFNLIENMLAGKADERPSTKEVYQTLENFIHSIPDHPDEEALTPRLTLQKNIWREDTDQLLTPGNLSLKLRAYREDHAKCNVLIYRRGTRQCLEIRFDYYLEGNNTNTPNSHCASFRGRVRHMNTSKDARQIMGIIPCSVNPKQTKLLYQDSLTETYKFTSKEDAFQFQREFTHYYVHKSLSYQASFKLHRKATLGEWIRCLFIRTHCKVQTHNGQIQLWTSEKSPQGRPPFNIKIAIITASALILAVPGNTTTYNLSVEGPSPSELVIEASVLEADIENGLSHTVMDLNDDEMDYDISVRFHTAIERDGFWRELKMLDEIVSEQKCKEQCWNRGDD